jgi:DNA-directed RNA polymerase specialized sigma24 family protein
MTATEIKDYLENYRERKMIAEYKKNHGDASDRIVTCITAIDECLPLLPDGLGEVLTMLYCEGKSLRTISERMYYGKTTLARRRDKAIEIMASCLKAV